MEYDFVEAYTYNSLTGGFEFHWKDDFNTFDTGKWHKADNTTFDANSTIFRASQAKVSNGKLILKMEPDVHTGMDAQYHNPPTWTPVMGEPSVHHDVPHQFSPAEYHRYA